MAIRPLIFAACAVTCGFGAVLAQPAQASDFLGYSESRENIGAGQADTRIPLFVQSFHQQNGWRLGSGNRASVSQYGSSNAASISQTGHGNNAAIIQAGNRNNAHIGQHGSASTVNILQSGQDLSIDVHQHAQGRTNVIIVEPGSLGGPDRR